MNLKLIFKLKLNKYKIILILYILFLFLLPEIISADVGGKTAMELCGEMSAGSCCCVGGTVCTPWDKKESCSGDLVAAPCSRISVCEGKIMGEMSEKTIIFEPKIKIPGFGDVVKVESGTIGAYVSAFYKWSVIAVAVLAVLAIVNAGFGMIFAGGNAAKAVEKRNNLFSAIIGLILILVAVPMLNMVNPALVRLSNLKITSIVKRGTELSCETTESNVPCSERGGCNEGSTCNGSLVYYGYKDYYNCQCSVGAQLACSGPSSYDAECLSRGGGQIVYKVIYKGSEKFEIPYSYQHCLLDKDSGSCKMQGVPCDSLIDPSLVSCFLRLPVYLGGEIRETCIPDAQNINYCKTSSIIYCEKETAFQAPCFFRYTCGMSGGLLKYCIPADNPGECKCF